MSPSRWLLPFAALLTASLAASNPSTSPTTRRAPATTAVTQPQLPLAANAPRAPFDLSDSATHAESVSAMLRAIEADLNADRLTPVIKLQLPTLTTEINARLDESDRLLESAPSLQLLENQEHDWQAIDDELKEWANDLRRLRDRLKGQAEQTNADGALSRDWQNEKKRAEFFLPNPYARDVMIFALSFIDPTIARIAETNVVVRDRLLRVYKLQQTIDEQDAHVSHVMESIRESRAGAFDRLFVRNEPAVWSLRGDAAGDQSVMGESQDSFHRQLQAVWAYIHRRRENVGGQVLLLIALTITIYFVRAKVGRWADQDSGFERAKLLFASPIATSIVLSILFSVWIYPQAPRLFWAIVGAAALIPTVIILRRLIDRRLFAIMDALVVFYFMDQIRSITAVVPLLARVLFLIELLAAALLLASFIYSIREQASNQRLWQLTRLAARLEMLTFAVALLCDAIGYVSLANLLGDAALKSAYLAVILYACISIVTGLLVIALRTRPLNLLGMVRRHQPLLLRRIVMAMQWIAVAAWLVGLLKALSVASAVYEFVIRLFTIETGIAGINFSLWNVTEFVLVVWASFIVSRLLRFILEEDVYDRFPLPGGLAYAISKMLNYVVLLLGFFVAVHALGYDMTKFTILAGAFGVGLGFGMQNILNNFFSGVILLFERPVKVGDVIQMNDVTGVVGHIGIRASILRTPDSSEIIIPNGNLISSQVTNWTLSNRQRGIAIPVSLGAAAEPTHVIALLTSVAAAHPKIVSNPPPQAFLTKFGADSFSYELHAWTNEAERWIEIRSDLAVALNAALVRENIPIR